MSDYPRIIEREVYKVYAGWVRRMGDGSIIGPFASETEAWNSYEMPKKQELEKAVAEELTFSDKTILGDKEDNIPDLSAGGEGNISKGKRKI